MADKPSLDRRAFLRRGLGKVTEQAVEVVEARVQERARHWIRPPYAIAELEFLLTCTRCDACVTACPHHIIFPLPSRLGMDVAGTPALDLLHHGCHLCAEWPCVSACEPHALQRPLAVGQDEITPLPHLAHVAVDTQQCLPYLGPECGACAGVCPVPGAMRWEHERPLIDSEKCVGCALCREHCIVDPKAITLQLLPP